MQSDQSLFLILFYIAAWDFLSKACNIGMVVLELDAIAGLKLRTLGYATDTLHGMFFCCNFSGSLPSNKHDNALLAVDPCFRQVDR
jgi:hypothetical protein